MALQVDVLSSEVFASDPQACSSRCQLTGGRTPAAAPSAGREAAFIGRAMAMVAVDWPVGSPSTGARAMKVARLLQGADQASRSQIGGVRGGRAVVSRSRASRARRTPGELVTRSHFDATSVQPAVLCRVPCGRRRRRRLRTTMRDGRVDGRSRSTGVLGRRREWRSVRTPPPWDSRPVANGFHEHPRVFMTNEVVPLFGPLAKALAKIT